jgi:hypothetical protein
MSTLTLVIDRKHITSFLSLYREVTDWENIFAVFEIGKE